jgi:hypothetical protein
MAEVYAMLAASVAQTTASAEETASLKAAPPALGAVRTGKEDGLIPPSQGWYPVDALYNFGPIRDLSAMRRTF